MPNPRPSRHTRNTCSRQHGSAVSLVLLLFLVLFPMRIRITMPVLPVSRPAVTITKQPPFVMTRLAIRPWGRRIRTLRCMARRPCWRVPLASSGGLVDIIPPLPVLVPLRNPARWHGRRGTVWGWRTLGWSGRAVRLLAIGLLGVAWLGIALGRTLVVPLWRVALLLVGLLVLSPIIRVSALVV
jgi:hypothetical protein